MLNCYTEGENILEQIINIDRIENAVALFGSFDENIKIIENEYAVTVVVRDEHLKVSGDVEDVAKATKVIENLLLLLNRGETISEQNVRYCISLINEGSEEKIEHLAGDCICITAKGKPLKPKTLGQKNIAMQLKKILLLLVWVPPVQVKHI